MSPTNQLRLPSVPHQGMHKLWPLLLGPSHQQDCGALEEKHGLQMRLPCHCLLWRLTARWTLPDVCISP